ncbi:MAG: DNA repair protein RecO [Chloroflexota bacterium]
MLATSDAIVMRWRKYGDTSKIATLYSREYGIISVIAKGARVPKSKFGASLETLSYGSYTFYKKPATSLYLLSSAEAIKPLIKISRNIEALSSAMLILDSINMSQEEREPDPELFDSLAAYLTKLNSLPNNSFTYFVSFQLKLAESMGFAADFSSLRIEGSAPEEARIAFSISDGEFLENYGESAKSVFFLKLGTAVALKSISESDLDALQELEIDSRRAGELHDFFVKYFSFHTDKHFRYKTFDLLPV